MPGTDDEPRTVRADDDLPLTVSSTRAQDEPEPRKQLGRYAILEEVGRGGMGSVYAAYDPDLDRRVALKVLRARASGSEQLADRLVREGRAMAKLSHPNVIPVYDVGVVDGDVFIAMELVDGGTLADWQNSRRGDWRSIVRAYVAAGRGLAAAHAAGLLHRDFKPRNVLRGSDGRTRVTDFGLARPFGATAGSESEVGTTDGGSSVASATHPLTATGLVMGTPAYMAPEQHLGQELSPRTDVYAFCVALYEGLHAKRPFDGETLETIAARKLAGTIRDTGDDGVPRWLDQAIRRGLAPDPADRWPSMDGLVAELERRLARRRRWIPAVAVVAVAAWAVIELGAEADGKCEDAEHLSGVWDRERKTAIERRFTATAVPYAQESWAQVERIIDEYAETWSGLHRTVCEEMQTRRSSEGKLDLQMQCLRDRVTELRALGDVFEDAEEDVVAQAVTMSAGLGAPDRCERVGAETTVEPPATEHAAAVAELRARIALAMANAKAGRFAPAVELAETALRDAEAIGYAPLLAEATYAHGELLTYAGDYATGVGQLEAAALLATSVRQDRTAAEAATSLVIVIGHRMGRPDDALPWIRHARAAIDRAELGTEFQANLLGNVAILRREQAHYRDAEDLFRRVLAIKESNVGPDHIQTGQALNNLGIQLDMNGHRTEAIAHVERSLVIKEAWLGRDHPDVAGTLNNLGVMSVLTDQPAARSYLERSLEVRERTMGPWHPDLAPTVGNLGMLAQEAGEFEAAARHYERSLSILERAYGPMHPSVAQVLVALGQIAVLLKRPDDARTYYERSEAIASAHLGADHPIVAMSLEARGTLAHQERDYASAIEFHERALRIHEGAFGPADPRVAVSLADLGRSYLEVGERTRAVALLERAVHVHRTGSANMRGTVEAMFWLAQAYDGDQPKRARRLAQEARRTLRSLEDLPLHTEVLREIDRWLAARPDRG